MIIRLTGKLAKKIKENELMSVPMARNPFADWTARLFTVDRAQYILITNTATLYSVVMFGKSITNDNAFIHAMLDALRNLMEEDGLGEIYQQQVAPQTDRISFAKSASRSATSSMNQMSFEAEAYLSSGEVSPFEVSFHLNESLRSYEKEYHRPKEVFRAEAEKLSNVIPIRR
jgi:hypothetical protein